MTSSLNKLDQRVQKWIYKQGWQNLRDIQEDAIDPILNAKSDVIISASTAAGKTEAFFLPACSATINQKNGYSILYLSPLKALINDQNRRLDGISIDTDINVTPWHGDIPQNQKMKSIKDPSGILLITPESLESLMIRDMGRVQRAFSNLKYIVIDEFHAFIGTERGQQLLSLLNRLEAILYEIENPIPRVALSATLGDLDAIPRALRQNKEFPCTFIKSDKSQSELKFQIKGYIDPLNDKDSTPAHYAICDELFDVCRGGSHLIFANSRKRTERIAVDLADMCVEQRFPNEFFPHHGSLDKKSREDLEKRLQKDDLPTTAICTMTLELGIDIGKVDSVIQVTAPHSVSSLRQRLGRSGRRGGASILRMFIAEDEIQKDSNVIDKLRLELLQSIAMIRLLIVDKWYEPAETGHHHFSTLLHQILAIIAQWGGVRADQVYNILCANGCFNSIEVEDFKTLLKHMGEEGLITQLNSGELVLGREGEILTDNYKFYAVFKTPEEFRLIHSGKTLGTLPVDTLLLEGQHIIFSGRRWRVDSIDTKKQIIEVTPSKGGEPPRFGGQGMIVHDRVRQEMLDIYRSRNYKINAGATEVDYLDHTANALFNEGLSFFEKLDLDNQTIIEDNGYVFILPWKGDRIVNTLTTVLMMKNIEASNFAGVIEIQNSSIESVIDTLDDFSEDELIDEKVLASYVPEKNIEKFDELLPESLLEIGYGNKYFDVKNTKIWIKDLLLNI